MVHSAGWKVKKKLFLIVTLLVGILLSACTTGQCPDGKEWSTNTREQDEMFRLINVERGRAGVSAFYRQPVLGLIAIGHSKNMACRNIASHVIDGKNWDDRIREGVDATYLASIVASGENWYASPSSASASEALNWWLNISTDPVHRANILRGEANEIGIGHVHIDRGSDYADYWTLLFVQVRR